MGVEERTHEGHRGGGILAQLALGHGVAVPRHRHPDGPRVHAGDLSAEDDAALEDVAGEDRLEVVEGKVEVDQLQGRGEARHLPVGADPYGDFDLDGRRGPASDGHGGTIG